MTDKQIIIDGFNLEYIKELLYNGQRSAITTKIFEEIIEKLERKEQECEELKENYKNAMTSLDAFVRNCADLSCKKLNIEKKYKKEICKQQKSIVKLKAENDELKKDVERWKSNFNGKVSAIEELIQIIQQALKDFSIEVGTPQYDRLLNGAKSLGIEVKDYE